jgi:Sap, sulfolipid-1-addressing protein
MIGPALGDVLPQAIGIAISPLPIIVAIVVMFSRRAVVNAAAFLLGWAVGVVGVLLVASAVADTATDGGPSDGQATVQVVLGLLFLLLAVRQWRSRPAPGTTPEPPKILSKVADMGPGLALALGLLFTVPNPKNVALLISAGAQLGEEGLSGGETAVVVVVFLLLTMIGVAAPLVMTLVMGDRAQATLRGWQDWLAHNNSTVMIVLFTVLAAKMLGSGISILTA